MGFGRGDHDRLSSRPLLVRTRKAGLGVGTLGAKAGSALAIDGDVLSCQGDFALGKASDGGRPYVELDHLGGEQLPHRPAILRVHDAFAWLAQIGMFLVLGLLAFPTRLVAAALPGLGLAIVLTLIARPAAVALCLAPAYGAAAITMIVRGAALLVAEGSTRLQAGDHVYVLAPREAEPVIQLLFGRPEALE